MSGENQMKITIKRLLIHALCLLGVAISGATLAQSFPDKTVTLVVPYPAGGATDVIGRMVAEKLPAQWKQQVVVTNRPGAGTTVAAEGVARAQGDGLDRGLDLIVGGNHDGQRQTGPIAAHFFQ